MQVRHNNVWKQVGQPYAGSYMPWSDSFPAGGFEVGNPVRQNDATFEAMVALPSTPLEGVLFEYGGSGQGAALVLRNNGSIVRLRFGNGDSLPAPNSVYVDVSVDDLPDDGEFHKWTWDFRLNPARVRFWVDDVLLGTGNLAQTFPQWSGANPGTFIDAPAQMVNGEPTGAWPGSVDGDLKLFTSLYEDRAIVSAAVNTEWVRHNNLWKKLGRSFPHDLGDFVEGGYYVGNITDSGIAYALILSPRSGELLSNVDWGPQAASGVTDAYDGPGNTSELAGRSESYPAAEFCAGLSINGFNDWYLPALEETKLVADNCHHLPPIQQFPYLAEYWSSTEVDQYNSFMYYPSPDYGPGPGWKTQGALVRAIRRVAL